MFGLSINQWCFSYVYALLPHPSAMVENVLVFFFWTLPIRNSTINFRWKTKFVAWHSLWVIKCMRWLWKQIRPPKYKVDARRFEKKKIHSNSFRFSLQMNSTENVWKRLKKSVYLFLLVFFHCGLFNMNFSIVKL